MSAAHFGLGTAAMSSARGAPLWCGPAGRRDAIDTVMMAAEQGVGFVDTAPFYGWGVAETIVAEAFKRTDRRVPIFTKCGTLRRSDGSFVDDSRPQALRDDVMASRDRLGVERIDLVQIHDPDSSTPIEASWEALMTLVDEGFIGAAGLSNHSAETMTRALRVGPVTVVQHQYSLLHRTPEHDGTLDWAKDQGIRFLAWAPLGSGFLTDDFDLAALAPDDLRRGLRWSTDPGTAMVVDRLDRVAQRHEASRAHTAISWLVRQGANPIVGARTPSELQMHLREPLELTDADQLLLNASHDR